MIDSPSQFPSGSEKFQIEGPVGAIEITSDAPAEWVRKGIAITCHPHSLHGGSMQNKVVTTCERALRELGLRTLRFNFRGVGASKGAYDNGIGEGEDLLAVVHWARQVRPVDEIWLAGFSFGAFVSISRAAEIQPAQLISLAPPVGRWPFDDITLPDCPWLVIQPEADEVVEAKLVFEWAAKLGNRIDLRRFADTSHFFHGKLPELRTAIQNGIRAPLPVMDA